MEIRPGSPLLAGRIRAGRLAAPTRSEEPPPESPSPDSMHHRMSSAAWAALLLIAGRPGLAQDAGEGRPPADQPGEQTGDESGGETVVVARKWEEQLQDVPASITVITEDELTAAGITTIKEASDLVPNVQITEFSSRRLSFPFVRGVGSGQGDPAVITYIDGVPQFGTGGTNLPLVDVERVEFLRGPQGTLYGRNALGGLIHVITKRPSETPVYSGGVTYGNHDLGEYRLGYSGPIGEGGPLVSLSGLFSKRDGYTTNDFTGNDVDDRDGFFGRAQVLFNPSDRSELRVTLYGERARDGGFVLSDLQGLRSTPHHIFQDFEGVTERDVLAPSVLWNHYGDAVDVTSITAYQDYDILETSDADFSFLDAVRRRTEEEQQYVSQELRVASSEGRPVELSQDASLRWLVGVQGFLSNSDRSAENELRDGLLFIDPTAQLGTSREQGDFDDYGVGVFGQATVTLHERLDLTAGFRYDYESKEADLNNQFLVGGFPVQDVDSDFDEDFDELLPKFSVAYRFDDELMVYGSAAKGFKAGGFNLSGPPEERSFGPETSWTYEVGARKTWLDGRLGVSGAVFYVDWEDMQLSLFDPTTLSGFVDNAGESTSEGFELEADAEVCEGLTLFTGFGYTDAEFDEFTDAFGADASGNELPFAPETTWSAGAEYRMDFGGDGAWYARGEFVDVGRFFYDPGNVEGESYEIVNFRFGLQRANWRFDLWVRNAFDEDYVPVALSLIHI